MISIVGAGVTATPEITTPLRAYFGVLRRYWHIVTLATLSVLVLTALALSAMPPRYTAVSQVLLDPWQQTLAAVPTERRPINGIDAGTIESAAAMFRAYEVIRRVAETYRLYDDDEFSATVGEAPSSAAKRGLAEAETLRKIRRAVTARRIGLTHLIEVDFTSRSPEKAAKLARGVTEAYLSEERDARLGAAQEGADWVSRRLVRLQSQAEQADEAVVRYRSANNILDSTSGPIERQQLGEWSAPLARAGAEVASARAKLAEVTAAMKTGTAEALNDALRSSVVSNLRLQEAEAARREAELGARYSPSHPSLIAARAELADSRRGIAKEIERIVLNLQRDFQAAQGREASLKQNAGELAERAHASDAARVALRGLEQQAATSRVMYESFLTQFKEMSERSTWPERSSRVVSQPTIPTEASSPQAGLIYAVSGFLGPLLGITLAFLLHALEPGFTTLERAEQSLRVPVVAVLSNGTRDNDDLEQQAQRKTLLHDIAARRPSAFGEGIRRARLNATLNPSDARAQVVMIVSSVPDEGKSTIALALAASAASAGARTLLIDADFCDPVTSALCGLSGRAGLAEMLCGEASVHDCVHLLDNLAVHVLPNGIARENGRDRLDTRHMRAIIDSARGTFDTIIVDVPSAAAGVDAQIVAPCVDRILFVIQWGKTARHIVSRALHAIGESQTPIIGAVLNRVALTKPDRGPQSGA